MSTRPMADVAPSSDWRHELQTALLNVPNVEVQDDCVSVPVDFRIAVETEKEDDYLHICVRAWDATGGVAGETEIGLVRQVRHAAALVRSVLREHAQDMLAEEAAMRGAPER